MTEESTRTMSVSECVVFLVVLTFLTTLNVADAVDCVLKESCILPCSFPPGDEVVIQWIQLTTRDVPAHSYYHNQDQFSRQDQRFRGRTSLFPDQLSRGNASLRLTAMNLQDQGRYKCYTSTITGNNEAIISLEVNAPVRKVDFQQVGTRLTCSSEGIYPEPALTWSTEPPSHDTLQIKPTVQLTEQLYNISSSLTVSGADLDYSCTVSTRRSKKKVTLFKAASVNGSEAEATIPCTSSNSPHTGLIWRFNHSQIILNRTGTNGPETVSEEWRQQVERVSESGSLTLKDLSSKHDGTYTCELSDADETKITNTVLRISQGGVNVAAIVAPVVAVILVAIILLVYKYRNTICKKCNKTQTGKSPENDVGTPLKKSDGREENNSENNKTLKQENTSSNSTTTHSSGGTGDVQERDSNT